MVSSISFRWIDCCGQENRKNLYIHIYIYIIMCKEERDISRCQSANLPESFSKHESSLWEFLVFVSVLGNTMKYPFNEGEKDKRSKKKRSLKECQLYIQLYIVTHKSCLTSHNLRSNLSGCLVSSLFSAKVLTWRSPGCRSTWKSITRSVDFESDQIRDCELLALFISDNWLVHCDRRHHGLPCERNIS